MSLKLTIPRRWLGIAALDFGGSIGPAAVRGELAYATIDVPAGMSELFSSRQWGVHLDVVAPLWRPRVRDYNDAVVALGLRLERVDYNSGPDGSKAPTAFEELKRLVPN